MRRSRPIARIPREVPQPKRTPDPKRSASHLAFVRTLPCCVCAARAPSEAAHIRAGTDGGMGVRPSDRFTVPMCHGCHARQHTIGELAWWSGHGVDPTGLAEHLWTHSGDLSAGTWAALRMAMTITSRRMAG
jgi:hypothetical protein